MARGIMKILAGGLIESDKDKLGEFTEAEIIIPFTRI